jgi:hypothetical protein
LLAGQICWSQDSIEFSFVSAEAERPDERVLLRYRSSPIYEWCELVEFEVDELLSLVARISSGAVKVESTSVALHFPSGPSETFHGVEYQIPDTNRLKSPYTWGGKVIDAPEFFAYFVISAGNRADASFSTKYGKYKLRPSSWSDDYFLCKWNLDYSSKIQKID